MHFLSLLRRKVITLKSQPFARLSFHVADCFFFFTKAGASGASEPMFTAARSSILVLYAKRCTLLSPCDVAGSRNVVSVRFTHYAAIRKLSAVLCK